MWPGVGRLPNRISKTTREFRVRFDNRLSGKINQHLYQHQHLLRSAYRHGDYEKRLYAQRWERRGSGARTEKGEIPTSLRGYTPRRAQNQALRRNAEFPGCALGYAKCSFPSQNILGLELVAPLSNCHRSCIGMDGRKPSTNLAPVRCSDRRSLGSLMDIVAVGREGGPLCVAIWSCR